MLAYNIKKFFLSIIQYLDEPTQEELDYLEYLSLPSKMI